MRFWWLVLLLMPSVFGASILDAQTNVIMDDNNVQVNAVFTVESLQPIQNLTLVVEKDTRNFNALINGEKHECSVFSTYARCGSLPTGNSNISISYYTSYPIAKVGENTILKFSHQLPFPTESQTITVRLPLGYIIPRETGKSEDFYITPKTTQVYSDGQHIFLEWESKRQELTISVVTKNVADTIPVIWIISSIIALCVTGFFILRKKKKALAPEFIDSEELIVGLLEKAENHELWQKQILHETEFSKAKLSRVIRNLEERGVIKKIPYGNTNKIALKSEE